MALVSSKEQAKLAAAALGQARRGTCIIQPAVLPQSSEGQTGSDSTRPKLPPIYEKQENSSEDDYDELDDDVFEQPEQDVLKQDGENGQQNEHKEDTKVKEEQETGEVDLPPEGYPRGCLGILLRFMDSIRECWAGIGRLSGMTEEEGAGEEFNYYEDGPPGTRRGGSERRSEPRLMLPLRRILSNAQ